MASKTRRIEIDVSTAALLEARAAARNLTLAELLADLAANDESLPAGLSAMRAAGEGPWSEAALAEDERRLRQYERTRMAVPMEDVMAWVDSWGAPNELPPPDPRKV